VPFDRGAVLSELHDVAGDLEREDTPAGVLVKARVPPTMAARLAPFSRNGRGEPG
jgi:GTP-binding protein HflX